MAEANARINVDINTSAAATGLRQLQSQITAFNSTLTKSSAVQATALRNSTQNLLELVNASRFFTAETVRMQTAAASLDKTLSKGQVTIGQFFGARFRKDSLAAAQVMSLANARASALQTQFIATGAAANGLRDAIAIRPLQAFNDAAVVSAQKLAIHRAMLNQATTQMINFGKNTQWAGRQLMVGFTVPLTIFAGVAGKTFRELEREAVNFRKVYGDAFTPPEEMEQNLQAVQELAKEYTKYGIAVKDTIALAAEAAAAGAQNKDLLDATAQATRLATLGQMQQNEALETTISLQNAFKLSGDELAKSINFLNMVENQTVVTLQDLSAAIPRVAPVIKGLGGDVEDLAAFMAALQEGGVTAEQGANALKSGLASLINPTDRAKEKLDSLGISLDSIIQMNRGDLMGVVQDFATALDTLDEFTRQQALEQVFGKFQYARLGALFANINKDGTQAARVLEMTGMSAAEMAASAEKELGAIEEAVGTKFTAAMEQLKLAIAPIGELFTKMAIPVINFFTSVIDRFNNLPDFAKTFSAFAAVIIGIVIPTGTMFLGLLMNLIGTLVKFGAIVGSAFKGFTSGGIKGAIDAVTQATGYMNLAEIDAANSAQQLAISTEAVNAAFLQQVTASDGAQSAVMELAYAYEILTNQMLEAAVANELAFGVGATAMGQAGTRGPRVRRNRGGTIPGSGNTDTVPAMLTPGEFVVNKQATRDNLPLLKAINKGAMIPGFNIGGFLAATAAAVRSRSLVGSSQVALPATRSMATAGRYQGAMHNAHMTPRKQVVLPSPFRPDSSEASDWLMRQIPGTTKKARMARELARRGLTGGSLSNDTLGLPAIINDAARSGSTQPLTLMQAADILEMNGAVKITSNTAMSSAGFSIGSNNQLGRMMAEELRLIARRSGDVQLTDFALSEARNRAIGNSLASVVKQTKYDYAGVIQAEELKRALGISNLENREAVSNLLESKGFFGVSLLPPSRAGGKTRIRVQDAQGNVIIEELGAQDKIKTESGPRLLQLNKGNIVPGQGNKDTVPAMLTPGEFVVNKDATQKNRILLEAINKGKIRGYELGGIVEALPGQYLVEGRDGRTFGPMPYDQAVSRSKQLVSRRARRSIAGGRQGPRVPRRGMMAGASMLGMSAMMGGMMIPGVAQNPAASTAMFAGGMALQTLPMLGGLGGAAGALAPLAALAAPVAAIGAALAVAGVAAYKWRDAVDTAARKAAEFGSNLGGTANAFNQIASLMGTTTPAQRQAALQLGFGEQEAGQVAEQFQNIFGSEQGQAFIKELEEATSEERFKKLSDYLRAGIAAGIMDKEMATGLAKAVSLTLGDTILGARTVGAIGAQETGAAAVADIAQARADEVSSLKEFTRVVQEEGRILEQTDAAKIIGGSIQTIQDFSNASALAREQLAAGEITQQEYNQIISQSQSQQALFTKAIEESLYHTTDFGGTMQGTMDQLIKTGLATEEGFKSLQKAAEDAAFSVTQIGGSQQSLIAAGISSIAAGMSEGLVTETISMIGQEDSVAQGIFQRLSEQVGGAQALQGTALAAQISTGQMFGEATAPIQRDILATNAESFAERGGDIVGLQSMLLAQSDLGQRVSLAETLFSLSQDEQDRLIIDYQNLAATVGTEFANKIAQSAEYEEALKTGTTDQLVDGITEASSVFGEQTQEIIDYAEKAGISLQDMTDYGRDLATLSPDLQLRLGMDITDPESLREFGPIAQSLRENWPILQNLNKNLDMSLYLEYLTVDENGDPLDPMAAADRVKELNRLWKEFEGAETLEARKTAYLELITLQNGSPVPEATYNQMWENLIADFGEQRVANLPADKISKIFQIDAQLRGAETAIEALRGMAAASYAMGDIAKGNEYISRMQTLQSSVKELEAERVSTARFGAPIQRTGAGGGGGGTPEKTIPEILREEAKLATGFAKTFSGKRGANFLAKPFGPEFLEYLRSQGQKGLELLKGNLKALQGAYKDFQKTQKAESLMVLQFMPGQIQDQLKAQKAELYLTTAISKQYGVSSEIASQILSSLDDTQKVELERLMISGKVTEEYKKIINEAIDLYKWNKENAKLLEYMAMSEEDRQEAIISNQMTINDLQRQLEELKSGGIRDLEDQVEAQQRIIDGISRTIELKQRESDAINRAIELKQRELEPIDKQIDAYEEQIDQITEYYDKQLEALDEVQKRESELEQLRRGQLDVASALSRGDVAAAASAAIELRRQFSEQRREDVRSALEKRRQSEIEDIQEKINQQQEKRKAIEEEINQLQLKQRGIQDEIYALQQSQIPIQDKIYNLQISIRNEADRLDNAYDNATASARSLELQLAAARREAELLAQASGSGGGGGGGAPGGGGGGGAPGGGGGTIGSNPFPDGPDVASKAQHRIWLADANFNAGNYAASRNYLTAALPYVNQAGNSAIRAAWNSADGRVRAVGYMYGGKVNYKGSTEPAPGFMMGGKVNKYAFGSFVPGTGMTDKVPAMLTPGEFVVRKPVAQKFGPMLERMNSQVFPGMGVQSSPPRSFVSQSAPRVPSGSVAPQSYSAPRVSTSVPPSPGIRFSNATTDFAQPLSKVASIGQKIMPSPNMRMAAPRSRSFSVPKSQQMSSATSIAATPRSSGGSSGNISYNNPVEYNYSITVNAQSVSSADDIASTVISKIKRIDDRNIKGVGL